MCGWKNQSLKLSERTWECDSCGIKQDRDVNAAKNIEKVALGHRETLVELLEFDRKCLWSTKGCVEPGRYKSIMPDWYGEADLEVIKDEEK
jgi:transposase